MKRFCATTNQSFSLPPPTHFYPDIPPQIVAAITRATQSAIGDRFASTQDFAAALTEASPATPAPQARAAAAGTMIEPPSQSPPSAPPSNSSPTPAPSPRPPPPKSSPPHGPQKRGGGMGLGLILLGLLFLIVLGSVAIFVLVEPAKDFLIDQMDSSSSRSSKKKKDRDDDDAPPKPREVALGSHSLRHGCLPRDDSYGSYVYITGVDVEQYRTVVHMSATNRRSRAIQFYVDASNRQGFHLVGSDGHPELYQSGVIGIENRRYAKRVQPGETVYFSVYFPELDRSVQSYHLFETEGFKSRSFDPQSTTSWTCLDVTLPME